MPSENPKAKPTTTSHQTPLQKTGAYVLNSETIIWEFTVFNLTIMFDGFTDEDFDAFAPHKIRSERFNIKRIAVWNKMKDLKDELDKTLRLAKIQSYRVSPYWISGRKREVNGIWIPFALPGIKTNKKYGYSYQVHPHVSLTIFENAFDIVFLIPPMAETYGNKHQSRFLTFVHLNKESFYSVLKKLVNLPKATGLNNPQSYPSLYLNILYHYDDEIVELDNKNFEQQLFDATMKIDGDLIGMEYIEIGFRFKPSIVKRLKGDLVNVCKMLVPPLFKLVKLTEVTQPLERNLLKSIYSVKKQYQAQELVNRKNRQITNRERKFIQTIKPKLKEFGLRVYREEFSFPTQDRADLILFDEASKRFAVAEVEITIRENNKIGLLQALKYRALFAGLFNERVNNVEAFLIAKKIHRTVKNLCRQYDVRYIETER